MHYSTQKNPPAIESQGDFFIYNKLLGNSLFQNHLGIAIFTCADFANNVGLFA